MSFKSYIIEVGIDYHLEKEHELGVILNMDKTLADVQCFEFAAVRDNSKRSTHTRDHRSPVRTEEPQQNTFIVLWEKKFSKFDTKIGLFLFSLLRMNFRMEFHF